MATATDSRWIELEELAEIIQSASGLFGYLSKASLDGEGYSFVDALSATALSGMVGYIGSKAVVMPGRMPNIFSQRSEYGPNSMRMFGQEALNDGVSGAVGSAIVSTTGGSCQRR